MFVAEHGGEPMRVEANRAQFHIRTAPQSGTLIEVVFPHALARP